MNNGLTPAQIRVLKYIEKFPGVTSDTIAHDLYPQRNGESAVSKILVILEQKGFIDASNRPTEVVNEATG